MLVTQTYPRGNKAQRGFTLIELMIAMVVGMIAVAGAIGLILAINQANSQTIHAARVNQELRALAGVIADDIKRARRLHDPISKVGAGALASGTFDSIALYTTAGAQITLPSTSSGSCIVYGYEDPTQSDPTSTAAAVANYRAISLTTAGNVVFASGNAAVACKTGTQLNSSQITITALTFTCGSSTATGGSCSQINLTISGQLVGGDLGDSSGLNLIVRTFTQPIFVRSGAVKTS